MKKTVILSAIALLLPLSSMLAQDDDMYFVPKKSTKKQTDRVRHIEYNNVNPQNTDPSASDYYAGCGRSVDDYNRRSAYWSRYTNIGTDSDGNDIIEFSKWVGIAPDTTYTDSLFAMRQYDAQASNDDYGYSVRMSRWDGFYDPWFYAYRWGYGPHWRYGWYDPWYYGGYYDPWYWDYVGWYGYYDPWYDPWCCYGGYWGPRYGGIAWGGGRPAAGPHQPRFATVGGGNFGARPHGSGDAGVSTLARRNGSMRSYGNGNRFSTREGVNRTTGTTSFGSRNNSNTSRSEAGRYNVNRQREYNNSNSNFSTRQTTSSFGTRSGGSSFGGGGGHAGGGGGGHFGGRR